MIIAPWGLWVLVAIPLSERTNPKSEMTRIDWHRVRITAKLTLHMMRWAVSLTKLLFVPPKTIDMNVRIAPISMTLFMFGLDIFMYLSQSHRFWTLFDLSKKQWRGRFGRKGRNSMPARPRGGVRFLGRGNKPPPHQLGGLGSAVSYPDFKAAESFWRILLLKKHV